MADIDFQPSKVERENVGKTTDATLSNAQNEINSAREAVPNNSKAEVASQTEAMTKGDKPILPAFDMSDFGDGKQSKDNGSATSSSLSGSEASTNREQSKDGSAATSSSPSGSDASTNREQSKDGSAAKSIDSGSHATSGGAGTDGAGTSTVGSPDSPIADGLTGSESSGDGSTKPTSDVPTQTGSDKAVFTPPSSTGNVTSAGSQTSVSP